MHPTSVGHRYTFAIEKVDLLAILLGDFSFEGIGLHQIQCRIALYKSHVTKNLFATSLVEDKVSMEDVVYKLSTQIVDKLLAIFNVSDCFLPEIN